MVDDKGPKGASSPTSHSRSGLSKYYLLETENFASEGTLPMTSYMRLGAVAQPDWIASYAAMSARTPSRGAITMKTGAGEDLASRLFPTPEKTTSTPSSQVEENAFKGFEDDQRKRAVSEAHDTAAEDKHGAAKVALIAKQQQLESAKMKWAATQLTLQRVLKEPAAWLRDMRLAKTISEQRIAALTKQLTTAQASPAPPPPNTLPSKQYSPNFTSKATRQAESSKLHTKGGWRDHTDGNRIVTTRGDKLEVIRGNYRMVVLGHTPAPENALEELIHPGWDVSGGHILEYGSTVSQMTDIKWTKRHNGTWYATEQTWKSDTAVKTTGDSESHSFGHMQLSVTGSDSPHVGGTPSSWHEPEDCPGGKCHINPKITNRTWATSMVSTTGSARRPVPRHESESWTDTSTSRTTAITMTDTTNVAGFMSSHTDVSGGSQTDHVTATTMSSSTKASMMLTTNMAALMTSTSSGNTTSYTRGIATTINVGAVAETTLGASFDLTLGASASVNIGATAEVFLGAKCDINISGSKELDSSPTVKTHAGLKVEMAALAMIHIEPQKTEAGLVSARV